MKAEFSQHGRNDLIDIWSFIAQDSVDAADRLGERFEKAIGLLEENPEAGRARTDLAKGLRSFPVGVYLILYRVRAGRIYVVRIIHGMRDVRKELSDN